MLFNDQQFSEIYFTICILKCYKPRINYASSPKLSYSQLRSVLPMEYFTLSILPKIGCERELRFLARSGCENVSRKDQCYQVSDCSLFYRVSEDQNIVLSQLFVRQNNHTFARAKTHKMLDKHCIE